MALLLGKVFKAHLGAACVASLYSAFTENELLLLLNASVQNALAVGKTPRVGNIARVSSLHSACLRYGV